MSGMVRLPSTSSKYISMKRSKKAVAKRGSRGSRAGATPLREERACGRETAGFSSTKCGGDDEAPFGKLRINFSPLSSIEKATTVCGSYSGGDDEAPFGKLRINFSPLSSIEKATTVCGSYSGGDDEARTRDLPRDRRAP